MRLCPCDSNPLTCNRKYLLNVLYWLQQHIELHSGSEVNYNSRFLQRMEIVNNNNLFKWPQAANLKKNVALGTKQV